MIEPPSRPEAGNFRLTGSLTAGHQNRLDDTLRKSGSSLAVVGFFVDGLLGAAAGAAPCGQFQKVLIAALIMPAARLFCGKFGPHWAQQLS